MNPAVPQEAEQVLTLIQRNGVCQAIVAGGCLRDADNGVPINDIDIYVPEGLAGSAYCALLDAGYERTKTIDQAYLTMDQTICSCVYWEKKDALPVNIIGVYNNTCKMQEQLDRFDFGICRIAYDGKMVLRDIKYQIDQANKTFTLRRHQSTLQEEYSLQRFERLSAKYPGWTLKR